MHGLSATGTLDLIERGAGADRLTRALLLHAAKRPGESGMVIGLGDLDRAAWIVRREVIGGAADAVATCGACDADLEFSLPPDFALPERGATHATVQHRRETWHVRLPTAADVADGVLCVERLAEGAPWSDEAFVAKAEKALEAVDSGMDVRLALTCPDCGAQTSCAFDPVAYVWAELEALGRQLIGDIAALARAFGWSESDILAMSPWRRARYLALAHAHEEGVR